MGLLDAQTPEQQEIARLEDMLQRMQSGNYVPTDADIEMTQGVWVGGDPSAPPVTPPPQPQQAAPQQGGGLLADPGQQQQGFQPSISPDQLMQLYGIMAAGADDPMAAGMDFAKRMQYNDMLRNQYREGQNTMTDAQRPRPIGGGFVGNTGAHINPVWDPGANDGQGGFRYIQGPNRMPPTIEVGGVEYIVNPNVPLGSPGSMIPAVDMPAATGNAADLNQAEARGTALGTDQAGAQILGGEMQVLDTRLQAMLNNPNFEGGVGWLDQFTGRVGAQFGTAEGAITKEANYIANALTRSSVQDWKGAISNAELQFFKDSVPQAGDGPETWRNWYNNVYTPTMAFVAARARGDITMDNSDLSLYLTGGGGTDPTEGMTDAQREAYERYRPQ